MNRDSCLIARVSRQMHAAAVVVLMKKVALVTRIAALFRGRRVRRRFRRMQRKHYTAKIIRYWFTCLAKVDVATEVDYFQKVKFIQAFYRFRFLRLNRAATVI